MSPKAETVYLTVDGALFPPWPTVGHTGGEKQTGDCPDHAERAECHPDSWQENAVYPR